MCNHRPVAQFSIPQTCVAQQKLAIHTLIAYASHASAFVVVAPPCRQREEGYMCDVSTYRRRLWCRAEQLCYVLRRGTERMWIASGVDEISPLSQQQGWLDDNLHIFGTCESAPNTSVPPSMRRARNACALKDATQPFVACGRRRRDGRRR